MRIFAIDPGPEQSAWVLYTEGFILDGKQEGNLDLVFRL